MACSTWKEIFKDQELERQYWSDVFSALDTLDLDWSGVRAELANILYDDREWAGRINIIDGAPKIVELVPSPYAAGEGPLPRQAAAMVPAEVVAKLEKRPALFMFHTHPKEIGGSAFPSATDITSAMMIAYNGHFAADLVISPYGVFLYAPNLEFRYAIRSCATKEKARLALYRRNADILAGLEGARSWSNPWALEDYISMIRRYDIEYVAFPTDKYAKIERRQTYFMPPTVDHENLHDYHAQIKRLESVGKNQEILAVDDSKYRGHVRHVHFAEPLERDSPNAKKINDNIMM